MPQNNDNLLEAKEQDYFDLSSVAILIKRGYSETNFEQRIGKTKTGNAEQNCECY